MSCVRSERRTGLAAGDDGRGAVPEGSVIDATGADGAALGDSCDCAPRVGRAAVVSAIGTDAMARENAVEPGTRDAEDLCRARLVSPRGGKHAKHVFALHLVEGAELGRPLRCRAAEHEVLGAYDIASRDDDRAR